MSLCTTNMYHIFKMHEVSRVLNKFVIECHGEFYTRWVSEKGETG